MTPTARLAGIWAIVGGLAGCSTTGPFGREALKLPAGPTYVGGRGFQVYPVSPEIVPNVKAAMAEVAIRGIVESRDPSNLIILEGRTAADRKARVTIQVAGLGATVSVKVGLVGDEPLTRSLLDRIGARQGLMPPPTAEEAPAAGTPGSILSKTAVPDAIMLRDRLNNGFDQSPVPWTPPQGDR